MMRRTHHARFFAMRTPLLPLDTYLQWTTSAHSQGVDAGHETREVIRYFDDDPLLREAVLLASPDLYAAVWEQGGEGQSMVNKSGNERQMVALARYFIRMASRPTPFGLFAGWSIGAVGDGPTILSLHARDQYRRRSRLDMGCVEDIARRVERAERHSMAFRYIPNAGLYRVGATYRYPEIRIENGRRKIQLTSIATSEYLDRLLTAAANAVTTDELIALLSDADVTVDEARAFVDELIDSQVLVAELQPAVTGVAGLERLRAQFAGDLKHPAALLSQILATIATCDLDDARTAASRYRALAAEVAALGHEPDLAKLVQVDLFKPADAHLDAAVTAEVERAVHALHRTMRPKPSALEAFIAAFIDRYERREMPLAEVLDADLGIGFPDPPIHGDDWLAPEWKRFECMLLARAVTAAENGEREIELKPDALAPLPMPRLPLPDCFGAIAAIAASSANAINAGEFSVLVQYTWGPSGVNMLGRVCDLDPEIQMNVEAHLRIEERLAGPGKVFAEIVHLPEGRVGNVLWRPCLREYEIPYLGTSGMPADRQLPLSDLYIHVDHHRRIVLRSRQLGCEVVPRLTTAHNFRTTALLPLYRLLCELQAQDTVFHLAWDWGSVASHLPFRPRVRIGRAVLSLATWRVQGAEVEPWRSLTGAARRQAVEAWRIRRHLPQHVMFAEGDNQMLLDLRHDESVMILLALARKREEFALTELYPAADEQCVIGPEGRFRHELIIPFERIKERSAPLSYRAPLMHGSHARSFAPGSEWLYVKLYLGRAVADHVIGDIVRPFAMEMTQRGWIDRWFFLRYGDPDWHLRIRFHGDPTTLVGGVLPALSRKITSRGDRPLIWRLQLDTYVRELERYGGMGAIDAVEEVFWHDSVAAADLLYLHQGDEARSVRFDLAARGVASILQLFAVPVPRRIELLDAAVAQREKGGTIDGGYHARAGMWMRRHASRFRTLLGDHRSASADEGSQCLARLAKLSEPAIIRLRTSESAETQEEIAMSLAHMHLNRVLRDPTSFDEPLIYALLQRAYRGAIARGDHNPLLNMAVL